ncbi:MAG: hypothetical protein JXO22_08620 [Phycisphaerae bacterium]|nr:hypothetical protein [Phycisphaerae bacterium]
MSVVLGTVIMAFLWHLSSWAHPQTYGTKVALPWHISAPIRLTQGLEGGLAALFLNALAMVAFFKESGGRRSPRLLWVSACGLVLLSLAEIGSVVWLIKQGWITLARVGSTSTSAVMYTPSDLIGACIMTLMFCLPLLTRLCVGLFSRALPEGPGYCTNCGYNLTGNVSGICPECGTTIQTAE